jgi:ABC-type multidrug transport system fused ATPase/permease subunit
VLFQETIADNIRFGCPRTSQAEVIQAARAACAHEFIEQLPEGYNNRLGEMGTGLSAGQKQRLSIARAILRRPSILILDEATSQLDPESEVKIHRVLRSFRGELTQFIIAHRLTTVIDADLIVVLDNGRLVSAGRHEGLIKECRAYRTLLQAHLILSREGVVAAAAIP